MPVLTSAHSDAVVLPVDLITGLHPFNLSAYGLRARWPTLRVQHYCCDPQGLATRWLARPSEVGFSPTRLHGIARSLQNRKPDRGFGEDKDEKADLAGKGLKEIDLIVMLNQNGL